RGTSSSGGESVSAGGAPGSSGTGDVTLDGGNGAASGSSGSGAASGAGGAIAAGGTDGTGGAEPGATSGAGGSGVVSGSGGAESDGGTGLGEKIAALEVGSGTSSGIEVSTFRGQFATIPVAPGLCKTGSAYGDCSFIICDGMVPEPLELASA